ALQKIATVAMESQPEKRPQWPSNLKTELPRVADAQKAHASTLKGREIEAACVAAFIYSQPIGEQAELADLRWMLGPTCDMPAVLNAGLIAWARTSWYLEETDSTEPGTNVPRYWRLGPKPNLNQVHSFYRTKALNIAKGKFDDLAKKCGPLKQGCVEEGVQFHNLPATPDNVDDDGRFRLAVLGADFAGAPGTKPEPPAVEFLRMKTGSSTRTYQNVVLVVTPSTTGLAAAEQLIADWIGWQDIQGSDEFNGYESHVCETVKKREKAARLSAETAVKNAYELVLQIDKSGAVQAHKITMGAQALLPTLLQEKALRIFGDKIDATAFMPGGQFPVWPAGDASIPVRSLYLEFAKRPNLPKLLSPQAVLNTLADAVGRGVLALKHNRSDGSFAWFWHAPIDVADWDTTGEAWLPQKTKLTSLSQKAIVPSALPGLWTDPKQPVTLGTLCRWFDGKHAFQEKSHPDYPPEPRPIPEVPVEEIHKAVKAAVTAGDLWLVFGAESFHREEPSAAHMDPEAQLRAPPEALSAIDLVPGALPDGWSTENEPKTTVENLYSALKQKKSVPWPGKTFVQTLNEAIGRGIMQRTAGSGPLVSLKADGAVALTVKLHAPPTPPPPAQAGRKAAKRVSLSVAELQNLADEIPQLTKLLAGMDVKFDLDLSIADKQGAKLDEVNKILEKVRAGWKL
ncbi:MAG: hypothetical protein HY736_03365, partial [Verrucomicrobia bacterium]|nr:hypothetical protein [Verrucomicrobiota bacterium]